MKTLAFRLVLLLALLLHAPALLALGLGQVEVRSRAGEPLLAEIPIISSDPRELEQLQARLASPDTFRRIGLDPPSGLVSDLRFSIALDPRGRPVVRITSAVPVEQPVLNFLVEVEWGQGRLVREYSVLVDTPDTLAAPAQPPIQAPQAAPSNLIERPAQVAVEPPAGPAPDAAPTADPADAPTQDPAPDAVAADAAGTDAAQPERPAPAAPAPPPAPAPAPRPAVAAAGGEYGPVQRGQTLSEIAAPLAAGSGRSLNQVMLALLRSNPDAFIGGNINLIRQGAVLRVPPSEAWSETSIAEANAVVREHVARWREMRRPVAQPGAEVAEQSAATGRDQDAATGAGATAAPRVADARLEIVPAAAGGTSGAGTRTGTAAGGEGDMLQQQELVQTRETLAARDAEVEELKTRLAELEQLQQQQAQLIQMKDSELAAAQQRLAESNAGAAAGAGGLPWLWIGLALVAAALLAAWLASRRSRAAPPRRPSHGFASPAGRSSAASADAVAAAAIPAAPAAPAAAAEEPASPRPTSSWSAPPAAATGASPTWHAAGGTAAAAASDAGSGAEVAPLNPAPAGQERIELARAYLDLGDTETARSLLQEVADFGDPDARGQALQLLRELA